MVRNAVRYAPRDSIIDVVVATAADHVVINVRDRGPGVPEEALAKLATPFYRVDEARDAASGGVDLGLAIARRAVERHGGQWQIDNANPGLRVEMRIPRELALGDRNDISGLSES